MTRDSYDLIQALAQCRSLRPGSWDWSFIHNLAQKPSDYTLSDQQYRQLQRLALKYRSQLARKGVKVNIEPKQVTK